MDQGPAFIYYASLQPFLSLNLLLTSGTWQVHLSSSGALAPGTAAKGASGAAKTPPAGAKRPETKAVALDEEGAFRMIQAALSGTSNATSAEQMLRWDANDPYNSQHRTLNTQPFNIEPSGNVIPLKFTTQ
jgi:hypothetical protein